MYQPIIGKESLYEMTNDNSALVTFSIVNNIISSTYFPHKSIYQETWCCCDGHMENQINHYLIDQKHKINIIKLELCLKQ